jgi:repressor LexA
MDEVAKAMARKSVGGLSYQYSILRDKGYLRQDPRRPRTVEVRLPGEPAFSTEVGQAGDMPSAVVGEISSASSDVALNRVAWVTIEGQVAAGEPILPLGPTEEQFPLPREVVGEGTLFTLKVVGDSMIGAGILDGDWVIVRQQAQAENGEIVAALIDGSEVQGTVKTLKLIDGHYWLMPQNSSHTPILGDKAKIRGKVVAVLRKV